LRTLYRWETVALSAFLLLTLNLQLPEPIIKRLGQFIYRLIQNNRKNNLL
jgi:hypothetical protein